MNVRYWNSTVKGLDLRDYKMSKNQGRNLGPEDFIVPFGQHEGKKIKDVPLKYLDWMMGLIDDESSQIHKYPDFMEALVDYMTQDSIANELQKELDDE